MGGVVTVSIGGLSDATQYYFRGYLRDEDYISYSDVIPFYIPAIPVVQTGGAKDITPYTAELYGEVLDECGSLVSERGFVWMEGTGTPTTDSNKVKVDGTTGAFTYTLGDLQPNKNYSFSSYAINAGGTAYGEVKTFTTQVALPTVSPTVVSSVTSTSATFTSSVKDHGGEIVYEIGFYYSTDSAVDPSASQKKSLPYTSDSFSVDVTGLADNTKYYVRSYAVNSAGPSYGTVTDFTTSASYPLVKTLECLDVTSTSAVLSGEVVNDNGSEIIERGFIWLQGDGIPSVDSYKIVVDGTVGPYTSTLTSLTPNQKYTFRAFATNAIGTSYGNVLSFTAGVALPSLAATSVTNTTSNSATFTSTVISHGGETVSEVGFYYSTDSAVDPSTSQKKSLPYSSDSFSLNVTGLADNTKYYVKSYAVNSAGQSYGTVAEFTTESSLPSVSTIGATDVTESSALISGEVVSDNGAAITERGFVWVKGTDIPTISSNRVKVEGTIGDYTVALSGLYPNQSYSYRAYARNSKGIAYGETLIFKTLVALPELELVLLSDITSSSAVVSAKVTAHGGETVSEVGFLYGTTSSLDTSTSSRVTSSYNTDSFLFALDNLSRATEYYIRPYATNSAGTAYGETAQFVTLPDLPSVTTSEVTDITETSAVCGGVITDDGGGEIIAKGVVWSRYENPTVDQITKTDDGGGETLLFTSYMSGMFSGTTYYVRAYVTNEAGTSYGEQKEFATYGAYIEYFDSANSFIVSEAGTYMFGAVKGNSMQSVGSVASVEVLWESFGTDEVPEVGSLISSVSYNNGTITFSTPNTYRKGNAVIAAKDASGITLWSWHIWLTDQPQEHVYNNYAGTMMDRNLGATSATPGDVGALGLLYQWGRKDPFLGTSSISSRTIAKSTISWPSPVSSDSSKGTIDYAISNPTTFIGSDENDEIDWYYTGSDITDDTRWQSEKTIYDPCPSGWRVPDGGDYGVWEAAGFSNTTFDSTNRGFSFSISNPSATWYPAAGYRYSSGGHCGAGSSGDYWSVTPIRELAFQLSFSSAGFVYTSNIVAPRARGLSVRCFKEDID